MAQTKKSDIDIAIMREILQALLAGVKAGGDHGAPAGALYAAALSIMSLQQFQTCMDALVAAGHVRHSNNLYYFIKDLA